MLCLSYSSRHYDKTSRQTQLEGEGVYFGSWFEGTVHHAGGGESRQQEPEVDSHITSIVRKQNMNSQLGSSFLCELEAKPREWCRL